ncbi:MAG: TetR/AcrR family transcriptional regulator [Flavobacteriaceae bacterium]|nr:TetR/AcrR family transcriptional regulator [Bacteroidia bacterium]NNK88692.1 TetR/AcrR family transcriptional regulator [Flavobacteriaceae bacterium]
MREKILLKSADLFLTLGFKSVTMDDIANNLGCSKKTIYQHFKNKTELVEATTLHVFEIISHGINCICALEKNPIEEIYDIKQFVMEHLKDEKSSPQYQLQKYYPKIYQTLMKKQFEVMHDCVKSNLERGIRLGLYREDINIEFVTRIYFNCITAIKDNDLFPLKHFSIHSVMDNYLDYHLHGICTESGLQSLNQLKSSDIVQVKS